MNNLTVNGTQEFLGREIPVIEGGFGNGKKVILAKTIAEIHEMRTDKVNALIRDNIDEFENGVDILDLKTKPCQGYVLENNLFTKAQWGNAKNIYLLSEQGYMALVMLMRTEKAKEIRKKLRKEYFTMREIIKSDSYMIQDPVKRALAWIEEEKIRQKQQLQLEKQKPLVDAYKQFLDAGENMDFATLGKHLGIGRNKLMAQLREWKVLMTDEYTVMGVKQTGDKHNQPYQKYMDKGLFVVKQKRIKTGQYKPVTLVTPLGATAIAKKLKKEGLI